MEHKDFFYNISTDAEWCNECYDKGVELILRKEYKEALYYLMRASKSVYGAHVYIAYCFQYGLGVERNPYAASFHYLYYDRPGCKMSGWVLEQYTKLQSELETLARSGDIERYFTYRFFDREIGDVVVRHSVDTQTPSVKFTKDGIRVYKSKSIYEEPTMTLIFKALDNRDWYRNGDNLGALYDGFTRDYPLFKVTVRYDDVANVCSVKRDGRYWVSVPRNVDMGLYSVREYLIEYIKGLMLKEAKAYLTPRVAVISKQVGLSYNELKIVSNRNYIGRFYSNTKNMELSYHLMKSTPEFVDAVIIHELSHVFGKSHDAEFYRGFEAHSSAETVRIDRESIGYSSVYDI